MSALSFGFGIPVGSWLAYDFDWANRKMWVGDRHRSWRAHDWRRPVVSFLPDHSGAGSVRHWQPSSHAARRMTGVVNYPRNRIINSIPISGASFAPHRDTTTHRPALPNRPRTFGSGSRRELPGTQQAALRTPRPASRPASGRQTVRSSVTRSGPRVRSLPSAISGNPLTVAPPLQHVIRPLPINRTPRTHTASGISVPRSVRLSASPLPNAAPPLPPTVPSYSEAPSFQPSPPASNRGAGRHHDSSRRGVRERKH